jgi:hypothetical protein
MESIMKRINYYFLAGLLILLLLSFGVSQLLQRQQGAGDLRLEIYRNGELMETLVLSEGKTDSFKVISESDRYNLVEIDSTQVRVAEAECPNQICVRTGWISNPGQVAVCAPNKLVLQIKGKSGQVDVISRSQ